MQRILELHYKEEHQAYTTEGDYQTLIGMMSTTYVAMFSELSLAVLSKLTKLHPKLQCDVLTLHDIVSSPIFVTNHMPYTHKAWLH